VAKQTIPVPDIGGAEKVDVIEVCVAAGDQVNEDDSLIVLESEKASMDIPSPVAGKVLKVIIKQGDAVSEGDPILELEVDDAADTAQPPAESAPEKPAEQPVQAATPTAPDASQGESSEAIVTVPDIGGSEGVDVIEVCVAEGDEVSEGDALIVLESDKASMDIPSPHSGKVVSLRIAEGDKVSKGDEILVLATQAGAAEPDSETLATAMAAAGPAASAPPASSATESPVPAKKKTGEKEVVDIPVPDIGGADGVDVIEVCVAAGDTINEGDSLIVLESDKASMEVPSPQSGKVVSLEIQQGDQVSEGTLILKLEVEAEQPEESVAPAAAAPEPASATEQQPKGAARRYQTSSERHPQEISASASDVYAGPAVRQLARQLGVDLAKVKSSGPRNRILKSDVRNFVKSIMERKPEPPKASSGAGIPPIPEVDFAQFGNIELKKMTKVQKLTAANMSRNWLNVPHVTQFDDADITELEEFRKSMKAEAEKAGVKLTPLPFLLKACAAALRAQPKFNVSLHADGEHLVQKDYVHIGIAVDTPNGLMVPVIRDVDKKGLYELAQESVTIAAKARDGKLLPKDMQGGCFTISSLGPIGGTGFTPIVNAPEVAILGVSKASIQPVWNGSEFVPRQMMPLSLSYDHRAINGADAGKFFTFLGAVLADVRRLIL